MELLQTIPIVRIFDVPKAREFYLDYLGFRLDWEHRFEPDMPLYLQVSKGGCALHLSEHYGDSSPGATVFLRVTGLEQFHKELAEKRYRYQRPQLTDPFGNRLRFNEDLR
jgi:catechol 2,3-dioxygenase-like lactoylglutathione lyase family enzyme